MKRSCFAALILLLCAFFASAQTDPLAYLRKQCPSLTEMYKTELENCHAHYIMAVDVSLSMCKYEPNVLPALKSFVKALPNGDKVTLIPFAQTADDNKMGFDVEITDQTKASLLQVMETLYPSGAERKNKHYYDTDIFQAQQAVARSVQQNAQYEVNIIIFITDMMHCPSNNIDRQFTSDELSQMATLLKSARSKHECRLFALELPQSGKPEGYVLPALKELYEKEWDVNMEQVRVPNNSEALIGQWFEKQKDRIMFTKLQAIIINENKANPIVAETDVDIDGNVKAKVRWTAGKLYPKITIDSTYIAEGSSFYFKENKDYIHYSAVGELNEDDMKLGKIKNRNMFFHQLADTLYFDVSLPVPYQDEIDKLLEGRPGPVAGASEYKDQLIWTFFLPLWLTAVIAALILLYLILVFSTMVRNGKVSFNGKIDVQTFDDEEIFSGKRVNDLKRFTIGNGGSNGFSVPAEWSVVVRKVTPAPFLLKKAYFEWSKGTGYVCSTKGRNKMTRGVISATNTLVKLDGGPAKGDITHSIVIKYFPNK